MKAKDIEFVVDEDGCIGVIIKGQAFIDYKGEALEMKHGLLRPLGKYETVKGSPYDDKASYFEWKKEG